MGAFRIASSNHTRGNGPINNVQSVKTLLRSSLPIAGTAILHLIRRHSRTVPLVVVLGIVSALLEGVGISLLIPLLSALQGARTDAMEGMARWMVAYAELFDDANRLPLLCLTIILLIALKCCVVYLNHWYVAWVDGRIDHELRVESARELMRVGLRFFFEHDQGRLLNIISSDTWRVSAAIRDSFTILVAATTVFIFGLILFALSWRLTLVTLAGVAATYGVRHVMTRKLPRRSLAFSAANSVLAARMLEAIESARLVRAFGREADAMRRFEAASEAVRATHLSLDRITTRVPPAMEVLYTVLFVAIVLGAWRAGYPFGALATFMILLYRLQPHFQQIAAAYTRLQASSGPVREVEWLLDPAGKPPGPAGHLEFAEFTDRIVFDNVSFSYGDPARGVTPVLENADFTIRKGSSVALIGSSGSGKSTIVNLLCRLVDPTGGTILVDGQPLNAIRPSDWRARIAVAGQDLELLDGTIAYNIAYGNERATPDEIRAAARQADADGFIAALPNGYDTLVGPRGKALSGGQRQRIALARALVRRPDILILDEATNAVDGTSEDLIIAALRAAMGSLTIIVISHRRSTIHYCDEAIVIDRGRVVETGPLYSINARVHLAD